MRTDTDSLSRRSPKKHSFSSIHCPAPEPGLWCAGDHHYFDKNQIDDLPKWIESATGKRIRIRPAGWEALIECARNCRSHEDGGRPCFASIETLRKHRSANTFRTWRRVWENEGLLDVNGRPGTGDQRLTNTCRTRNDTEHKRKIWNLFPRKAKRNFEEKSCRVTCSSMGSQSNTKTDPEPEPIHETGQRAKQGRMFDNVYSGNTAETPIKTPIPAPDVPHVLAFRQTIANWFGVAISFKLTLWLLCLVTVRRWNITAFLRDVERNHKPRLFRSQEAAWRFITADYESRGPTLDAIPPEKSAQAVEGREQVSVPQSAESPPVSYARLGELCAEFGTSEDRLVWWMLEQKKRGVPVPLEWPPPEAEARDWIGRYRASVDRSRASASSDASSSNRASSDISGGGAGGEPADG
jgi:hypothetical protein